MNPQTGKIRLLEDVPILERAQYVPVAETVALAAMEVDLQRLVAEKQAALDRMRGED
jgi:hypothetical protein